MFKYLITIAFFKTILEIMCTMTVLMKKANFFKISVLEQIIPLLFINLLIQANIVFLNIETKIVKGVFSLGMVWATYITVILSGPDISISGQAFTLVDIAPP